ncbi:MAG: hypothetical protein N2035_10560, partial [Chthoniobacterales bacterium]|nr:hypothetical protein [Chthoniobacterales bacterium]
RLRAVSSARISAWPWICCSLRQGAKRCRSCQQDWHEQPDERRASLATVVGWSLRRDLNP